MPGIGEHLAYVGIVLILGVQYASTNCSGEQDFQRTWTATKQSSLCTNRRYWEHFFVFEFYILVITALFWLQQRLVIETRLLQNVQPLVEEDVQPERPPRPSIDEKATSTNEQCVICLENKRIYALDCGHLISCAACRDALGERACPFCRAPNTGWRRIFY